MMIRRSLAIAVALSFAVAACSGTESTEAALTNDDVQAVGAEGDAAKVLSKRAGTTTTLKRSKSVHNPGVDELAFAATGPDAFDAITGDNGAADAAETPTTAQPTAPAGGGSATPVTTVGGGGGGDVAAIYRGIVGTLGPHDVVAAPVVDPPAVVAGAMPLTGTLGEVPNRPAAVVKIDNGSAARPQTGLNKADIVVEEEVEGGITRFAAIFHSQTTEVGPVRSGRTTDIGVMVGLGSPLLMYSGANDVTDTLIRRQSEIQNHSAATSSGYWRNRSRKAPSNLYTDTAPHWASAAGGPPPPQFAFRAADTDVSATGSAASTINVAFRANSVSWSWDGGQWLRRQGGRAHTIASGGQVSAANVVVIEANEVATGMVDASGANVPEFVYVGTGRATVFTAGRRIDGVWTRPTLASVATLTTAEGAVIELTPGRTWVEIIKAGAGLLSAQ